MTPCALAWLAAGSPPGKDCAPQPSGSRCWVCAGEASRGVPRGAWMGATYTGQNRVKYPAGTVVCEPCVYLHGRLSPVPGRPAKEGKQPPNWRNFCVFVEVVEGVPVLTTATKGEKDVARAWLRRRRVGPWFACIAESGQKHLIPAARMNGAGDCGWVNFEERDVRVPGPGGWALVDEMAELLTLGSSKEGLASGEHSVLAWSLIPAEIETFEERWAPLRGAPWFERPVAGTAG